MPAKGCINVQLLLRRWAQRQFSVLVGGEIAKLAYHKADVDVALIGDVVSFLPFRVLSGKI